jgi:hypothetical protein
MPRHRTPKPKPPPSAAIQAAIDRLLPLMERDKAAIGKWPDYRRELMKRPDHPKHQEFLDERERRNNPGSSHRG